MPTSSIILRVFIASTSEVEEERKEAYQIIYDWNAVNSSTTQIFLEPVGWKSHSHSEMGDRPQAKINPLLEKCDMLIGIFWTRFGRPTGKFESGTQEEIELFKATNKPLMLYFSNAPISQDKVNQTQNNKVQHFKKECQKQGLIRIYNSINEFHTRLTAELSLSINKNFSNLIRHNTTGILRTYKAWSGRTVDEFINTEKELNILLKDGHTFFSEKKDLLLQRILKKDFVTKLLILHPLYEYIGAVADMDEKKQGMPEKQKNDCLNAIITMHNIRKQIKQSTHEDISKRIVFLGYKLVPTWNGFIGDRKAYIHLYPTFPYRGDLLTLEILARDFYDEETEWYRTYKNDFDGLEREAKNKDEFNMWKFHDF